MSWMNRFLIGVIVVGLAFIASLRLYRAYENYVTQTENPELATQTFNNVPVKYGPAEPDKVIVRGLPQLTQEIYLEDIPLEDSQEKEQARQTLRSILDDYRQDPKLQAFYAELKESTGQALQLEDLSGENLGKLLQQYPQVQAIITKHAQDPEFAKTLQEIFSNPQFIRSVAVLQGKAAAARK